MQLSIGSVTFTAIKEKNVILFSARKDRKPHQWNMQAVGKALREKREAVRLWLMGQVND